MNDDVLRVPGMELVWDYVRVTQPLILTSYCRPDLQKAKGLLLLKLGKIPYATDQASCPVCRFSAQIILSRATLVSGVETEYSLYSLSAVRALLVGFSPHEWQMG